ncbi:heavy-metal-associated domain-containing protein [Sphingomonas sp.]|uniref:heavy-metal-associated domain-containing protein n=1 Tax=Sphingomonas sp. TaxID=28214 RepID=UPI0018470AB7|nr:heavy-metal-associated domain-containing protein [Sphingomonas sp.]MBA3511315.1 heavy-metal-associated domain-containing protein [Sphingomonas sp.]
MLRRTFLPALLLFLVAVTLSGALYAQLESGERGILPIDSSGTLEITGIHVDVGGKDAASARYSGWRLAQRQGFRALWAKTHGRPISEAPSLPDSTLDGLVSSITIEREQIGPNRYIADLGILFDRARAGEILGVGGPRRQSPPMLLIPILVSGGTATSVELRNSWQRAWAQFRTSQSTIDYVRVSGMNVDPLLVNAAQTNRPGRGWWRNIVDLYGAADILVAQVQLHRLYPGGPARARFIARHGPDNEIVGGFTLTAPNSDAIPAMMNEGVRRMDELFMAALEAGALERDPSLDIPEPPPLPELEEEVVEAPRSQAQQQAFAFQVQITAPNVTVYNFAMAHLRTVPGIEQVTPQSINPGGTSYILVSFRGSGAQLAAALIARGWSADYGGTVVRMRGGAGPPPPVPPPPPIQQPQPQPQPPGQPVANTQ